MAVLNNSNGWFELFSSDVFKFYLIQKTSQYFEEEEHKNFINLTSSGHEYDLHIANEIAKGKGFNNCQMLFEFAFGFNGIKTSIKTQNMMNFYLSINYLNKEKEHLIHLNLDGLDINSLLYSASIERPKHRISDLDIEEDFIFH